MSDGSYLKDELYKLIKSDEKIFDFIQAGSLDGIWYWDIEKPENEWMSHRFWETLGYDPSTKKHLSSEWQDIINENDLQLAIENLNKHFENPNYPYDQIVRYKHKDGSTVYIRCRGLAIRGKDGKPVRMLGAHTDVTALKKQEKRIKENELRWKFAVEGNGDGLWDWNLIDNSVFFSTQWKKMLGFAENEIEFSLEEWSSRVNPEQLEKVYADINAHLEGKTDSYRNEHQILCKDGTYKWVLDRGVVVERDDDGKPTRMIGTHTDINQEKLLQVQSESIAKIIDDSLNEVYIFDAETLLFSYINKGAAQNIGYSLTEMKSMTAYDIKPELDKATFYKLIEPLLNGTKDILVFETIHQRKDGSLYNVEVHLQLTTYKGKKQFVAIILDTTVRNTLLSDNEKLESMVQARTSELKKAKEEAENANKYKSEFLANMSHEIRTPMTGILGFVERLKKSETDPVKLKELEIISSSGNTLLNIINDILDFSKIESGKLELEMHPFKLHQMFAETISMCIEKINEKKISYVSDIDVELPNFILGDEVRLKRVIFNLLSNAVKFTPENGEISVSARYKDSKLFISVSDTGIGIAKDKLKQIFEAFRQEDTSTTRKYGGTGLGLSIATSLVQKMGGVLKVESEAGKGSEFYFEIPIQIPDENEAEADNESSKVDSNIVLNGNILVVEDNKTNQMLLGFILDELGVEYDIANDGVEAVKMYTENQYKLILMDENMPNMNGIEATKQIRFIEIEKSLPSVPIVAVTANALAEDRQRFLDAGMDDYLSKPYNEEQMIKMVVKFLS